MNAGKESSEFERNTAIGRIGSCSHGPQSPCQSARLNLNRVTLHFIVKRWPLDPEQLRRLFFVAMGLGQRLQNRFALNVLEAGHSVAAVGR